MGDGDDAAEDTRAEIMGATYRALCRHGYANLTMQNIADEFDKSKSLLHYHYDTKEDLLVAFLDNLIGWLADRLDESDAEGPVERLDAFADRFVIEPGEERRESFALALMELRLQAVHNEAFRTRLAAHYQRNLDTFADILAEGVERGKFRAVDPERTARVVYAALEGARMRQVLLGEETATRETRAALDVVVEDALLVEAKR
jgi:AcrR family transcriptional regulator